MDIFYSDHFPLPLPEGHRFPMSKYSDLRRRVEDSPIGGRHRLVSPPVASDRELMMVHASGYVDRVVSGTLDHVEIRRIGFPWSPEMVERSRRSSGATIAAARSAVRDGVAVSLAGGTHHAFSDRGEGFCVFNDSIVAARVLQSEGLVHQVAVIDCDVHQGNGTASIAAGDESIFTFSIHGAMNFPFKKERSDLDIGLPDQTGDEVYLEALQPAVESVLGCLKPDLVIYIAGADPYQDDRWGRLSLSKSGLGMRDQFVLESCAARGVPVAVTMGGGYAPRIEDIVDIHFQTVQTAAALLG